MILNRTIFESQSSLNSPGLKKLFHAFPKANWYKVADGHPNALSGRPIAFEHFANEEERFTVFYAPLEQLKKNSLVYAVEKLPYVCSPHVGVRIRLQKILSPLNGCQQSFSLPTRPSVINKSFVPDGNEVVIEQAVNHAVPHGGYKNLTAFIITHHKRPVRSVLVCAIVQVLIQIKEAGFKIILKLMHLLTHALAFAELKPSSPYTS